MIQGLTGLIEQMEALPPEKIIPYLENPTSEMLYALSQGVKTESQMFPELMRGLRDSITQGSEEERSRYIDGDGCLAVNYLDSARDRVMMSWSAQADHPEIQKLKRQDRLQHTIRLYSDASQYGCVMNAFANHIRERGWEVPRGHHFGAIVACFLGQQEIVKNFN